MAVAASIVGREYETHVTGRESAVPEAEPVRPLKADELAGIAGLEARRRPFTALFHDLGNRSAVWPGRRGLIEVSAARRLVV
jgi:hypothetical protein